MKTKTIAILAALSTTLLFACSGGSEAGPASGGSQSSEGSASPAETSDGQSGAAAGPSNRQPDAGPEEASSPVARCSGRYHMTVSDIGDVWLHRNKNGCVVGADELVLRPDGKVAGLTEWIGAEGTWTGDEFHFEVRLVWKGGNYLIKFERLVAEPSK